jgi:phage terminase large subunit
MPSLRLTAYKLIVDLLKEYGIYNKCEHNKSENTIKINDNFMLFISIDDPEKIKSSEWNYIWLEEANEFNWNEFIILETRLSGKTTDDIPNQIFFSLNPNDELIWINQKIILNKRYSEQNNLTVIHSSYKDNPFLEKGYINIIEGLEAEDPNYWRIYGLGLWGSLQNIIYQPYLVETKYPESFDEIIYGLDFGFNNPSALIEIAYKDQEIWLTEKIYRTHLTNQQLIDLMKDIIPEDCRDRNIYGDTAEPARIEEISGAGFNIAPSDKSVKDGIDYCKRKVFHTRAENVNLNKERQSYKWKEDKNGNILDEPVKFNNHAMDAKRYGVYTHAKSQCDLDIRFV